MAARRTGPGKGLEAFSLPGKPGNLRSISVDRVDPNPNQPRQAFDEDALESLTASISRVGVLQPVVVRPVGPDYVLIAGERRWRAAQAAGLDMIPALVRETDDQGSLTEALIENIQREDLSPLEEAAAFRQLEEDFGMTHSEIAERVGRSRSAVSNTLRLLNLSPAIQEALGVGDLSAGHARALLGLKDRALAEHLAERAVAEGWSVRRLEEAVRAGKQAGPEPPPTGRKRIPRPAAIIELEHRLAEQIGTKVRIDYRNNRGQVVLNFAGIDQLERIYRKLFAT